MTHIRGTCFLILLAGIDPTWELHRVEPVAPRLPTRPTASGSSPNPS